MNFLNIVVGLALSFVVARVTGLPFIYGVAIVAVLWTMSGGTSGGLLAGITGVVRGTAAFFKRLIVGLFVFTGLTMIVCRVVDIPPGFVTGGFQVLGPAPWNWPILGLPMILVISVEFLVAWVAMRAAAGDVRIAGCIFAISAIVIFTMMWTPRLGEAVRPKAESGPATPLPGEKQAWADTDQSAAEHGVIPTVFCTVWSWSWGPKRWPCGPAQASRPAESPAVAASTSATKACKWEWGYFDIAPGETHKVPLKRGADLDPDGPIKIISPSGKILRDPGPGGHLNFGQETGGEYLISSDPPNVARKVKVRNCWPPE